MRKLFLTSSGIESSTEQSFLKMLTRQPESVHVGFIANAADPEPDKSYVQKARNKIREMHMNLVEIDLKRENAQTLQRKMGLIDVMYVNGGNTFYLLDLFRKSGFGELLPKILDQGKIYVGVSAGSIITGLTIESAGWFRDGDKNDVGLTDTTGLQIVPFAIFPHVNEAHKSKLVEQSMSVKYPIIGLSDTQAIASHDETFQIVGGGEKLIYNPQFLKTIVL